MKNFSALDCIAVAGGYSIRSERRLSEEIRFNPPCKWSCGLGLETSGAAPLLAKAIRGHAAEFGITGAIGLARLRVLIDRIAKSATVPALCNIHAGLFEQIARIKAPNIRSRV